MKKTKLRRQKVAVIGANGRMGLELQKALIANEQTVPYLGVVREGSAPGFVASCSLMNPGPLTEADVWIDFSTVENFVTVVQLAAKLGRPLVSGTTGLSNGHERALRRASKDIPVLWSPNMSVGVAALKKALCVSQIISTEFDFQIEELHHNKKKDKPSGTALYLQEELKRNVSKDLPAPLAIRGGGIAGVHKVWMMSDDEVLMFEHQALNRSVFAKGAVRAALWLVKQKKGLYSMDDLFGKI